MGRRFDPDRAHVNSTYTDESLIHEISKLSIVILCHKRTWHLKKVLDALSLCPEVKESEVIFVAQDSPSEVLDIINDFKFAKKTLLKFNNLAFKSSAHAINHNLFAGLKEGFLGKQSKYCIVLEDDIVVAPDAINFLLQSIRVFGSDKRFRGVMSYSFNQSGIHSRGDVVKINFGIGFGWIINDSIYKELLRFWTGNEENHWDYFVEPYTRTGFLIAPLYSKILNIGFDESATHSAKDSKLGNLMEKSFRIGLEKAPTQVKEIKARYQHLRKDLCVISSLSKLQSIQLYLLREISFKLYKLALKDKPRIHFIWRKLRNFTDQRFSNVSQASST